MKKKFFISILVFILTFSVAGIYGCKKDEDNTNNAPVLTINGEVPAAGIIGVEVVLPTASATDDVDGDISNKVKLTVALLKEDGSVRRELLYEVNGNIAQKFTPANNTTNTYKITYSVKNNAGLKSEKFFDFLVSADTQKPVLTLNTSSVEGFDITNGINAKAAADILLPSATAIDNPGSRDISSSVVINVFEIENGTLKTNAFAVFTDTASVKNVRLAKGEYLAQYIVKDGSNNESDEIYTFKIKVAESDIKNLAADKNNFAFDNKEGMAWFNQFDELSFGHTSIREPLDQTVGFTLSTTKIYDEIVGISFTADAPGKNGQSFYTLSARGSKNRNTMPDKETCTWPNYLFLRISSTKIESRIERTSDKSMSTEKTYNGLSMIDGKQHTLYVQWKNEGSSPTATGAKIWVYGWVDKLPTSYSMDYVSFAFSAARGDSIDNGKLVATAFDELWSEAGAGWFSMDTYTPVQQDFYDDHMRVNGLVVYSAEEKQFALDMTPPVITVNMDNSNVYPVNEEIDIPAATVSGETEKGVKVIFNGEETAITSDKYIPTQAGKYTIVFWATDDAGNFGYKKFDLNIAQKDIEAPVLTLSSTAEITVALDEELKLPTATAIDNIDGNISSNITVLYIGKQYEAGLKPGESFYPKTVGIHKLIYTVSDSFGNDSIEKVIVNVTGGTTGDLTDGLGLTASSGVGYRTKEYIYDQKVSMLLSIPKMGALVGFNVRGPIGSNGDWPTGMVLRIASTGVISISAKEHDSMLFGSAGWSLMQYWVNTSTEALFEYKVSDVKINETDYIKVQVWIQEEELVFSPTGGLSCAGLEEGSKAIYMPLSAFKGGAEFNMYSSPFWITSPNGTTVISELRIDGTSCEKPIGPTVPEGLTLPAFNTGNKELITSSVSLGAGDNDAVIGKYSNEDYIAITFKANESNPNGAILFNVTGTVSGWSGGLIFRISKDGIQLRVTQANGEDQTVLCYNKNIYTGGTNTESYTLVYKLTYNVEKNMVKSIGVDAWIGIQDGTLEKLLPIENQVKDNISFTTDGHVTVNYNLMTDTQIICGDIKAWILEALNGGQTTWTVKEVKQLDSAPIQ